MEAPNANKLESSKKVATIAVNHPKMIPPVSSFKQNKNLSTLGILMSVHSLFNQYWNFCGIEENKQNSYRAICGDKGMRLDMN